MEAFPFRAVALSESYDGIERIPVSIVLDRVRSLYNVGSFFRTGDASGLEKLYLTGYTGSPPHNGISKTALGAEQALEWERHEDPLSLVRSLRAAGHEIAVVETAARAVDIYDWRPTFPVCVIFGNEVDGVTPALADLADVQVRIPTLGSKPVLSGESRAIGR